MGTRLIYKGQRGFTLIELVIVIGLVSIISGGLTMIIMQVFNADARTRSDMIAVYQVRQAGKLVSEDFLEARDVTPGAGSGFPLTLTWEERVTNDTHNDIKVIYTLVDMPSGELQRLARNETVTPPEGEPTTTLSIVAEHIDAAQTGVTPIGSCSFPNCGVYTFTVTATAGGQSETRVYQIKPRPGS
jgi:prepilin-type N-terminal cleavage/methylation domain-containing protein